ncbi:hypothetical protein PIB30_022363 [Stylosanthes scabra]|uniref:Uncharacterized protein n=1 Tax=Stylosanthes scabra TaxID=79078 RepID=A0ABU6WC76_9FABA|nr:hypothetical protein [Stylosanthes scabra]
MSARPEKGKKIFGLYEDSFHDFKGRYFKIFPVGEHRPLWLSLEGQGRFPSYWSFDAGVEYVPVTYRRLNADQQDIADILIRLFFERNLKPKMVIGRPSEATRAIIRMAGQDVTLSRLRNLIRPAVAGVASSTQGPNPTAPGPIPATSGPSSVGRAATPPAGAVGDTQVAPKGESTNEPGQNFDTMEERDAGPRHFSEEASGSHFDDFETAEIRRDHLRLQSDGSFIRRVGFHCVQPIGSPGTGVGAVEIYHNHEVHREPRLTMLDESERRNAKLVGDLKALNQVKASAEAEKVETVEAKDKAEADLKALERELGNLRKSKDAKIERLCGKEKELEEEVKKMQSLAVDERSRADLAQSSAADLKAQCDSLAKDAKSAVAATEATLKAQLGVLLPDFDSAQIGFFKDIVDGKVVDLPAPQ